MNETRNHRRNQASVRYCDFHARGCANQRAAFTLIEMLVATALTLMLVAALAQAFSIVGTGVSTNRASLEMAGQLRAVSLRLQDDLSGLTIPTRPWPDPSAGLGYFEYLDGADHDAIRFAWSVPNTSFGDADDILMFTARNDRELFLGSRSNGTGGVTTIESPLAEIVWFATLTDVNGNGTLEPAEFEDYTLYRRTLLIRPDLGTVATFPNTGTYTITSQPDLQSLYNDLRLFFSQNDLSVRLVTQLSGMSGTDLQVFVVANTLGDLTKRENRFAHRRVVALDSTNAPNLRYYGATFPFSIDRDFTSATSLPLIRQPFPNSPQFAEPGAIKTGDYQGEDVMLPHLLAFDIRAYDPLAIVAAHVGEDGGWGQAGVDDDGNSTVDDSSEAGWARSDDEPMIPGDYGFGAMSTVGTNRIQVSSSPSNRYVNRVGSGAFVDLNYGGKVHGAGATAYTYNLLTNPSNSGWSHFSSGVATKSQLSEATYDTWSFHYEYDGINQDGDTYDHDNNSTTPNIPLIDEGTNALDTDGINGVDDLGERETSPPYLYPLRAIQVRIRIVDHSSRQVRQATVESSFVPN
ncbi:MAG: type II secretion system protein [Planctomycetaceae bacterium]|nr:type II secretion system protein [Planctomycetales bacterium]MCB9873936.1 type II secretion system protein [Planctomycetaceae bacterium]MCB9938605.1 type II secretion system protein [Planctomycetaceae bacterium]